MIDEDEDRLTKLRTANPPDSVVIMAALARQSVLRAPDEGEFTATFGALLPPASYVRTARGQAAFYVLPSVKDGKASTAPEHVLLLHGVQTPALGMLPLTQALQAQCPATQFVLLDLWGHGLSDTPTERHSPHLFLDLIDELVNHLQWLSFDLIGYSFSGLLAQAYVVRNSTKVHSCTLIAPAGLIQPSSFSSDDMDKLHSTNFETAWDWVSDWLEGGPLQVPTDYRMRIADGQVVAEAIREWQNKNHEGHRASVVDIIRHGGVIDSGQTFIEAGRAGVPTLAILGGQDGVCSQTDLSRVGYDSPVIVPGADHALVRKQTSEIVSAIIPFWRHCAAK